MSGDFWTIPKDIDENLQLWALEFSKEMNYEKWLADYFKESMERLILLLLGLNLRKTQDGSSLDFEYMFFELTKERQRF